MSGISLVEMDSADMLDVFHYLFEDDNRFTSGEQVEGIDKMRTQLYRLYGQTYDYGSNGSSGSQSGGRRYVSQNDFDFDSQPIMPMDGKGQPTKSYIAPTDFNPESAMPFGNVLDAPLG